MFRVIEGGDMIRKVSILSGELLDDGLLKDKIITKLLQFREDEFRENLSQKYFVMDKHFYQSVFEGIDNYKVLIATYQNYVGVVLYQIICGELLNNVFIVDKYVDASPYEEVMRIALSEAVHRECHRLFDERDYHVYGDD